MSLNQNYNLRQIEAEEPLPTLSMNPKKFALWLILISIIMIFASLTSAYIVRRGEGNWLQFQLPPALWLSSVTIVLSSVSMQLAYFSASKDNIKMLKVWLLVTTLLGFGFIYTQILGFTFLVNVGVFLVGNPAGSFVYILIGTHALHLLAGIVFLLITLIQAFRYRVHATKMNTIDMCTTFWHFLGVLWLYLFVFLLATR